MNTKRMVSVLLCATLLGACGGAGADDTSTTARLSAPTTALSETTTTSASAEAVTTTTAVVEETTTTVAGSSGDLDRIRLAMETTAESAPSTIEGSIQMRGMATEVGSIDVEMPMSIRTDATTGNSAIVMDMGAMAAGLGDAEGMAGMGDLMGSMEIRQIGDVVYMKYPLMSMLMGAQTEWLSMPADEPTWPRR